MKILGLGTSKFLIYALKGFKEAGFEILGVVSLKKNLLPDNSVDLKKFTSRNKYNYFETADINSKSSLQYINNLQPDLIFSNWPKIISKNLTKNFYIIGCHPTNLPNNRGRHPIQWTITQSIKKSKLSFFLMDEGVDSGNLILQLPFAINKNDDINSVNERLNELGRIGSKKIGLKFFRGKKITTLKQSKKNINYWRKKDRHDVIIDFRMRANEISSVVRSFTSPYPCSFFIFDDNIIKVSRCEVVKKPLIKKENIEPGKILKVERTNIIIKCHDEFLKLEVNSNLNNIKFGKYIYPPTKYIMRYPKLKKLINK